MTEIFKEPDNNPWQTLANVTGEDNTYRLQNFVYGLDALRALILRGQATKRVNFGNQATMKRLTVLFNQEFPGRVNVSLGTIMEFVSTHGDPDEYGGGVIGACTGITDRLEPSDEALAQARSILDKL